MKRNYEDIHANGEQTSAASDVDGSLMDIDHEGQSPMHGDGDGDAGKKRRLHENYDQFKHIRHQHFLPPNVKKNVVKEIVTLRREVIDGFRAFFGGNANGDGEDAKSIAQLLHAQERIDALDDVISLLDRYMELKYPLQEGEKVELLKYLYPVASSLDVDYGIQSRACTTMCALIKGWDKEKLDVTFAWRPLYRLLDENYFAKYRKVTNTPRGHGEAIVKLVRKIRRYFAREATDEIIAEFKPMLCLQDFSIFKAQAFICTFLPTEHGRADIIDFVMLLWNWVGLYPTWDNLFFELFARFAYHNPGKIDWKPYVPTLFTRILKCFDLPIGNAPPSMYDEIPMLECQIFVNIEHAKNTVLIDAAKLIAWMLQSDNGVMDYLHKLMHSIESFFHPSNEGPWSSPIGDFLLTLTINFSKRFEKQQEKVKERSEEIPESYMLTSEKVSQFVDIVMPIAMISIYSKSQLLVFCARHVIKHIAYLAPDKLFPQLMERCFHALQTLTETHQTVVAMETLALVTFPLFDREHYPDGIKYLADLLALTIPGIDSNDLRKTYACLQFYSSLLSCVPISTTAIMQATPTTPLSPTAEKQSRSALVAVPYIEDWCIQFLDRLFQVISSQGPPKDGQSTDAIDSDMFWGICDMFFNQLSDNLYDQCMKKVYKFATTNLLINAKKNVGHMCGAASYVMPEKALPLFVPTLYDRLVEDSTGKLKNLTTQEICYFLYILSQVIFCSGAELLKYRSKISKIIELTWDHEDKKVVKDCGKLLRNVLRTCTFYYSKDLRSLNPAVWNSESFEKDQLTFWAQFPPVEELQINWHVPTQEELDFGAEVINTHMTKVEAKIRDYIELVRDPSAQAKLKTSEQSKSIRHALKLMNYMLKSSSVLFSEISTGIQEGKDRYPGSVRIESGLGQYDQSKLRLGYASVGNLFCDLAESLMKYHPDTEPNILTLIAKTLYPIFCVRGGSTGAAYKQKLTSQKYVKGHTFRTFAHKKSTRYPRYVQVLRTVIHLKLRYVLHNESLKFTETHQRMLSILVSLSLCSYSSVRRKAQDVLMAGAAKFSYKVLESFLPRVISAISDKSSTDDKITGACYIIERPSSVRTIILDWELLSQLMMSLCQTSHVEKQTVQDRLLELYETYYSSFYQTSMDDRAVQVYTKLINDMLELAERNPNWHWKFQIMVASLFSLLVRTDSRVLFPIAGIKWLFRGLVSDVERLRQISMEALSMLYAQYKPVQPREILKFDPSSSMIHTWQQLSFPNSSEEWEKTKFFEKNWFGWYSLPKQTETYIYSKDPQDQARNIAEDKVKPYREQLVQQLRGIMTEDFAKKYFELIVNREDSFSENNAQFYKGMFQILGPSLVDICKPHFEHMLSFAGCGKQEENHYMSSSAEWVAGLLRGIKHWDLDNQTRVFEYVFPLLETVLDKCSNNCISDWSEAIEFSICDKDPRRSQWIRDLLLRLFERSMNNPNASSAQQTRSLKMVYAVLAEIGWRDMKTLESVLQVLTKNMQHPYQQVRTYISLFIALICKLMWSPERDEKGVPLIRGAASYMSSELRYEERMESIPAPVFSFLQAIELQIEETKDLSNQKSMANAMPEAQQTVPQVQEDANSKSKIAKETMISNAREKDTTTLMDTSDDSTTRNNVNDTVFTMLPAAGGSKQLSSAATRTPNKKSAETKGLYVDTSSNGSSSSSSPNKGTSARFKLARSPISPTSHFATIASPGASSNSSNTIATSPTSTSSTIPERVENNALKSLSRTVLITIGGLYSQCYHNSVIPYTTELMSVLMKIQQTSDDEEILEMAREDALIMASFPYSIGMAKKMLYFFVDTYAKSSNWKTRANLLDVLQIFGFLNQFHLMDEQRTLFDLILALMKDSQFEVREQASETLAGFLKMSEMKFIEDMARTFSEWAKQPVTTRRKRMRKMSIRDTVSPSTLTSGTKERAQFLEDISRHSGVLGISAIIMAFPYELPDVLIPMMVKLSKFSADSSNSIRETVKKTFAQFWKTHHDTWSLHKSKFTEDELLELTDLLVGPSYYA